jgi:hypothetical protein
MKAKLVKHNTALFLVITEDNSVKVYINDDYKNKFVTFEKLPDKQWVRFIPPISSYRNKDDVKYYLDQLDITTGFRTLEFEDKVDALIAVKENPEPAITQYYEWCKKLNMLIILKAYPEYTGKLDSTNGFVFNIHS